MVENWSKNFAKSRCKLIALFFISALTTSTAIALWIIDPLPIIITMSLRVVPNSTVHEFLKKEMTSIQISMYLFNITNEDNFLSGEDYKIKLQEVGPFTYRESRINEELELDMASQEVRYSPRLNVTFVKEDSIADAKEVVLTLPNIAMLSAATAASKSIFTKGPFNLLTLRYGSTATKNVSVHDFLWGYQDRLLTLGNRLMPGVYSFDKIGLLDRFYDTKFGNRLVVSAKEEDKFVIKSRNGYTKLQRGSLENADNCEECSSFENTYEGIIFPAYITPEKPLRLFRTGLCKVVDLVYNERRIMDNKAEALVYNISDEFFSWNLDGNMQLDMTACFMGIPLSITKGHFLGLDPSLYERIEGLSPDPSRHTSYIIIEPITGTELDTFVALQINMVLNDLSFNGAASPFSNIILPVAYLEIKQMKLPEDINQRFILMYYIWPKILLSMRILLILMSVFLVWYQWNVLKRKPKKIFYHKNLPTEKIKQEMIEKPLIM